MQASVHNMPPFQLSENTPARRVKRQR